VPEPFEPEPFVPEPLPPAPSAIPPVAPPPVAPGQATGQHPTVQPGVTGGFQAVQQPQAAPVPTAPVVGATATRGQSTTVDPTQAQQIVARRMAEAKATIPEFQVEVDVDMTAAAALREQLRYGVQPSPSVNDIVVKATALALRQFPRVNGAYKDGRFEYYNDINVGVVVSAGELLAVPTIFNADQKGLAQIAREVHELAAAVRARQIQPAQLAGGTFTISNLGMFGVPRFNAIINPPQAGILAVGSIQRRPIVAEDGFQLQVRPVMTLTLSVDHRIVYGQEAAEFLGAIKSWLENPHALQV
jgi:pyruvate dehydrogenase E2 component (dihydrolipoamide acetyltransferase)